MDFGKWKLSEDCACWVCSVCGASALNDYAGRSTPSTFCPHCGKPMTVINVDFVKESEANG
jgi:rubrerythrin